MSAWLFEHRREKLIPHSQFLLRVLKSGGFSLMVLALSLGCGILGYHVFCHLGWVDSLLNASMILAGMGPVNTMDTRSGKIFASAYALFSGMAFLTIASLIISPFLHRLLHALHVEE